MDGVSAAASALAVADAVIKLGKFIYEKYKAYKEALQEIHEHFLRFESSWFKVNEEIEILQCIMHVLEVTLVKHFENKLTVLLDKFSTTATKLNLVIREDGSISRIGYALWVKSPLTKAVKELEDWTWQFYPSWFASARELKSVLQSYIPNQNLGNSQSAKRLESLRRTLQTSNDDVLPSIEFLNPNELANRTKITGSSAELALEYDGNGSHSVLIDGQDYTIDQPASTQDMKDVQKLAAKLSSITGLSNFGLLQCRGVLQFQPKDENNRVECAFVFHAPRGLSTPISLRNLLLTQPAPSINDRIELAKRLARSVMFVQNYNFVHKNIRPESIIVFRDTSSQLREAFLTGFQFLRASDGPTLFSQKAGWAKDLYRHPARQGEHPAAKYFMQHDIYSLGVCLLEIGLWSSFCVVVDQSTEKGDETSTPGPELPISELLDLEDQLQKAWRIKNLLFEKAERALPAKMGAVYTDVVLACLSSWEDQDTRFGIKAEFQHRDGVNVSVRYSERVVGPLEEILL